MKYKGKTDIGKQINLLDDDIAFSILKVMSSKTWINEIPSILIELIDDNYDIALETVKYVPNIYFQLNKQFRKDRQLRNATIKSFRQHHRVNEINIRAKPLTKRKKYLM